MSTEERLTALESDRAILNRIASEQLLRLRDLEHNVTILVGVQGSQGQDIRAIKADVSAIKEQMSTEFASIHQQLATIVTLLSGKPPTPPEP